jgi:hypothetical protein
MTLFGKNEKEKDKMLLSAVANNKTQQIQQQILTLLRTTIESVHDLLNSNK